MFDKFKSRHNREAATQLARVQTLTDEICKLKNETVQIPALKMKLGILQQELKDEKRRYKEINDRLQREIASKSMQLKEPSFQVSSASSESLEKSTNNLSVPLKSHKRYSSYDSVSTNYSGNSLFSMNDQSVNSNMDLDLQLMYEESNKSMLEKLKLQEMENAKLIKMISELQTKIEEITVDSERARQENVRSELYNIKRASAATMVTAKTHLTLTDDPHYDNESVFSLNSVENAKVNGDTFASIDFSLSGTTIDAQDVTSPTSTTSVNSVGKYAPIPKFEVITEDMPIGNNAADLRRSEYFCKTLRKQNSHESLLSLNKQFSKQQLYYNVMNDVHEEKANKRSSLKNFYQAQVHKVSPRPKSVMFF